MRYQYHCDNCGFDYEVQESIKVGPPKHVLCSECSNKMHHELGCNFVLKGDFPGKRITRERERTLSNESAEKYLNREDTKQKEANEVLKERRKGSKHFKEWSKHNKDKVKRYCKNLNKENIKGE
jgi:predicted nucleic acid-binding Zn ribbon protein